MNPASPSRRPARAVAAALLAALLAAGTVPVVPAYADESASAREEGAAALASSSALLVFDQRQITEVGKQARDSVACMCFTFAYAQTITSGTTRSWVEYNANGNADETSAYAKGMWGEFEYRTTSDEQSTLRALYDAVNAGKPSVVYVSRPGGWQHWVCVVGYQNASDPNNLSLGNFLMLDPASGSSFEPEPLDCRDYSLRFEGSNLLVSNESVLTVPADQQFVDVEAGQWYEPFVEAAADAGYMTGYEGSSLFGIGDEVLRCNAVLVLYRIATGADASEAWGTDETGFTDIQQSTYYTNALNWAKRTGLVTGDIDPDTNEPLGTFRPDEDISREELAKLVACFAESVYGVNIADAPADAFYAAVDWQTVDEWARPSFFWTSSVDVLSGQVNPDGTRSINPHGVALREQLAKIVVRLEEACGA